MLCLVQLFTPEMAHIHPVEEHKQLHWAYPSAIRTLSKISEEAFRKLVCSNALWDPSNWPGNIPEQKKRLKLSSKKSCWQLFSGLLQRCIPMERSRRRKGGTGRGSSNLSICFALCLPVLFSDTTSGPDLPFHSTFPSSPDRRELWLLSQFAYAFPSMDFSKSS